jgi:16S rRNA (cytosine1407-C5)-methyltransferase
LRKGGLLIYSTCTFEEAENDLNVEWAAAELGAEVIIQEVSEGIFKTRTGALLVPGFVRGEGQFAAALMKTSSSLEWKGCKNKKIGEDPMRYIPESIRNEAEALSWLHPIRIGVELGSMKGKDFVPSADAALVIGEEPLRHIHDFEYEKVEVDRNMALRFLHRDSIFIEGHPKGVLMICFEGHPLGFVKNVGNRWNSLMPQGRRIRMDVENLES